jgi:hypothetical protein
MVIQIQEVFRPSNRQDQKRTSPYHTIIKTLSMKNKERILKTQERSEKSQMKETHQNNSRFLNRNFKSKEGME